MSDPSRVIAVGDAAVDWTAEVDTLPEPDSLVVARSYRRFAGGSAANVATGLARLGHSVSFIGQIGDDEDGRFLLEAFEAEGIGTDDIVTLTGHRTPATFVVVEEGGGHTIVVLPRVPEAHHGHAPDLSGLEQADALHIGPSHTELAMRAGEQAQGAETLVYYAPGGVARFVSREEIAPVLEVADVLLVSSREAAALAGCSTPEESGRSLLSAGPTVVVVTTGAGGALLHTGDRVCPIPALPVPETRDTTGAGDAFAAGVIGARLRGFSWEAAAHVGSAVAGMTIQRLGARTGLPDWEEALAAARNLQRRQ